MNAPPRRSRAASTRSSEFRRRGPGEVDGAMSHQLTMRLNVLEMEMHRRGIEREAALARMRACEARCRGIEGEVAEIKKELHRRRRLGDLSAEAVGRTRAPRASARGGVR